jgi:hypothetical protein
MQIDIRQQYEETLKQSHQGHPEIVQTVHTGCQGHPHIHIDPDFLRWAYDQRSVAGISWFLHVGHNIVWNALLEYGIAEPQDNPFQDPATELRDSEGNDPVRQDSDDLLDPNVPHGLENGPETTSFTAPLSVITDDELDILIQQLHQNYLCAGITMLDGMLRHLGLQLP